MKEKKTTQTDTLTQNTLPKNVDETSKERKLNIEI